MTTDPTQPPGEVTNDINLFPPSPEDTHVSDQEIMHSMCTVPCGPDCIPSSARARKIPHPSGDDGGDGLAWVPTTEPTPFQVASAARLADALWEKENLALRTECIVDGKTITVMSFKGTGVCSEFCRKVYNGEIEDNRSQR